MSKLSWVKKFDSKLSKYKKKSGQFVCRNCQMLLLSSVSAFSIFIEVEADFALNFKFFKYFRARVLTLKQGTTVVCLRRPILSLCIVLTVVYLLTFSCGIVKRSRLAPISSFWGAKSTGTSLCRQPLTAKSTSSYERHFQILTETTVYWISGKDTVLLQK